MMLISWGEELLCLLCGERLGRPALRKGPAFPFVPPFILFSVRLRLTHFKGRALRCLGEAQPRQET
jgi:hypothetical protein